MSRKPRPAAADIPLEMLKSATVLGIHPAVAAMGKGMGKGKRGGTRSRREPAGTVAAGPVEMLARGTVICAGTIFGRAVPWKAPKVSKHGGIIPTKDYQSFQRWQNEVGIQAAILMARTARRLPYRGNVAIEATYYLRQSHRTQPDTVNLHKAFVDSLQSFVIVNDTHEVASSIRRVMMTDGVERVEFRVTAE